VKLKLARTKQCAKCPWRKSTDPNEIPNGYSKRLHRNLKGTIAEHGTLNLGQLRAMACHESKLGEETHCIGWLANQMGPGNNIGLRFQMMRYDLSGVELIGEQHETFEETLGGRA
jgi:Family of unknown function (DUF6283)